MTYLMTVTWVTGEQSVWRLERVQTDGGGDPIDRARKRAVKVLDGLYGKNWPAMTTFSLTLLDTSA